MNFKNVITTGLITATLLSTTTTYAQATPFTDIPSGHWSENSINYLADKGIVSGYGNEIFGFGDNVTRGQVCSIISRYLGLKNDGYEIKHFSDIKGHMFEDSIKAITQAGIMTGDNTDKFRPDDTLTRYEMAVILQKTFHLPVKANFLFHDVSTKHWARDYVRALYSNGVTSGIGKYQYGGDMKVTREQFAKFMYDSIFVDPNFVPKIIPIEPYLEGEYLEMRNLAVSSGFFHRNEEFKGSYIFNPYGKEGDFSFDVMDLQITPNTEYGYRMFVYNGNSAINEPIKNMFNKLLPTQADYLYN